MVEDVDGYTTSSSLVRETCSLPLAFLAQILQGENSPATCLTHDSRAQSELMQQQTYSYKAFIDYLGYTTSVTCG